VLISLAVVVAQIVIIILVKNLSTVAIAVRVYTIVFCLGE
jgi:hypothetical protein